MKRSSFIVACVILACSAVSKTWAQTQTVKNGDATTPINFPGAGCVYNWVNSDPSIGLPASGTGNIASFTAVNNGDSRVTATVTATPVNEGFAYILSTIGQISVINTTTGKVIANSKLSFYPFGEAVSPDGRFVYCTDPSDNLVITLDAATYAVLNETGTGADSAPRGIAVSPDGSTIYVTCEYPNYYTGTGTLDIIDAKTYKITATVSVGASPLGVAVSADGSKVYVASQGSNIVSVINTTTAKVVSSISVGINPNALVVTHDGSLLYVSSGNSTVSVINTVTNQVVKTIRVGLGPIGITISPDDKNVYVVNKDTQTVSVISTASQAVIAKVSLPGGDSPFSISMSPDGTKVYVVNQNGLISVINTASNMVTASIPTVIGALSFGSFVTSGIGCNINPVVFNITVNPVLPPKITASGNVLRLNTVYGTPSSSAAITAGAENLASSLLVTAPAGFEISTDNLSFTNTVTLNQDANGTVAATTIYMRVGSSWPVGDYPGVLAFSSAGANAVNLMVTGIVTPAPLTINAQPVTKTYGTALSDGTGAYTVLGLKNGETVANVMITYGAGASATDLPGIYFNSVNASGASGGTFSAGNYAITYQPATITVDAAVLTIIADNQSKAFGTPNPMLTMTYAGFVNNDGPGQLTKPAKLFTDVTLTTPAGEYPIVFIEDAVIPGYMINKIQGVFTVYSTEHSIIIPNTFTPNDDGINDKWRIQNIEYYAGCTIEIFNRWGQQLYYTVGYNNAWDGRFSGKPLPAGTYYYLINLNDGCKPLSGYVCIIR